MYKPAQITPEFAVASQISVADLVDLKSQGYQTIVNNRPDGEVAEQTPHKEKQTAAAELNLPYSALVVASNWAAGRDPSDSKKDLNHQDVASKAGENLGPVIACIEAIISRA